MKLIIFFSILLFSLNIAFACEDITMYGSFKYNEIACNNLNNIVIVDTCNGFPPPGDCWEGYEKAEIVLPDEIKIYTDKIKNLNKADASPVWDLLECTQPGTYEIKVVFDDGACEKTLTLDLTKEYQEPDSGSSTGGSSDNNDKIIVKDDDFIQSTVAKHELDKEELIQLEKNIDPEVIRRAEPTRTSTQIIYEEPEEENIILLILLIVLIVILGILVIGYIILRKMNQERY